MIKYFCSNGSRVSEATIKSNLSKAYRKAYEGEGTQICRGCGEKVAQGSGHLIPKARLKQLHLTELIWNPRLFLPMCYCCNGFCENVTSQAFRELLCYERCMEVLEKYDPERYQKAINA